MAAEIEAKTCVVCKQDCSGRPRQKDDQGRYTCQSCLDKQAKSQPRTGTPAKAGAPAGPAPTTKQPQGDPALAAALAGVDQTAMTPCPNCAVLQVPGAVVCTSCGFDFQREKPIRTRVQELSAKERNAPGASSKGGAAGFKLEPKHLLVVLLLAAAAYALWSTFFSSQDGPG